MPIHGIGVFMMEIDMPSADRTTSHDTSHTARIALWCVAFTAMVWLLDTGTQVFLPFLFALVVGVVFAPLSDRIDRLGAPRVVGALAVLMMVLGGICLGLVIFYPVIAQFILRLPVMWAELQEALSGLKSTMQSVKDVQSQVSEALNSGTVAATEPTVVPGAQDMVAYLPSIAAQILVFVGILYFFLLTRSEIYAFIERNTTSLTRKVMHKAEVEVSRYFLTVTAINAAFGTLVTLMLTAFEMPNAIYWGFAAFLVNFVLYLGPICFAVCLAVGGLIVFDGPISFAPAALFLAMNMMEGQFVTPSLVGRHMSVNPLLVFISLVFWLWLWGPLGGVIAIPMLVWIRQINKAIVRTPTQASTSHDTPAPPDRVRRMSRA